MGRAAHLGHARGLLIVNPRSGNGKPGADELERAAARRGIEVHVLEPSDDVRAVARVARGPVGVAGGDGSLGLVAEAALERDLPFVCVPFGTRNHFARDIGLDRDDPFAALAAFESGRELRIDAGRVAGRVFLNNVSFGIYAHLVHRREAHRRRREAFARLRALWLSVRDRSPEPFVVDGERVAARVVLVANNAYELDVFDLGARDRLDEAAFTPTWRRAGSPEPGRSASPIASCSSAPAGYGLQSTASRSTSSPRPNSPSSRARCAYFSRESQACPGNAG
jgi:hypothetical protein